MSEFVNEILDEYLRQNSAESKEIKGFMKLSETSFDQWDNEEDAVYNSNYNFR